MNLLFLALIVLVIWWLFSGVGGCCGSTRYNDFPDRYTKPCDASRIAGYNLPLSWNRMCSNLKEGFHGGECQSPPNCVDCEKPFRGYDLSHREIFPIYWQEWKM